MSEHLFFNKQYGKRTKTFFAAVVLYLYYYSYRYVLKVNSTGTSPTYGDTPFFLQFAKYAILLFLVCALFLFYIILIVDFTLIDDALGRDIFGVLKWNTAEFNRYINESTNLIPFETLKLFLNAFKSGTLPFWSVFENVFGNFVAFMPLPFFTVCLFKKINKWYTLFAVTLISVLLIELLQLLLLTGASDIDDVILNVSGAMLFYALLRIPAVSRLLNRFTMGVWE